MAPSSLVSTFSLPGYCHIHSSTHSPPLYSVVTSRSEQHHHFHKHLMYTTRTTTMDAQKMLPVKGELATFLPTINGQLLWHLGHLAGIPRNDRWNLIALALSINRTRRRVHVASSTPLAAAHQILRLQSYYNCFVRCMVHASHAVSLPTVFCSIVTLGFNTSLCSGPLYSFGGTMPLSLHL